MPQPETKTLEDIRGQLAQGEFAFSRHALRRLVERNISEREIRDAGANAIIIEDYPDDKYAPSCLILGFTRGGRPLHMQVSLTMSSQTRIVTIYEPTLDQWEDYSRRR